MSRKLKKIIKLLEKQKREKLISKHEINEGENLTLENFIENRNQESADYSLIRCIYCGTTEKMAIKNNLTKKGICGICFHKNKNIINFSDCD